MDHAGSEGACFPSGADGIGDADLQYFRRFLCYLSDRFFASKFLMLKGWLFEAVSLSPTVTLIWS